MSTRAVLVVGAVAAMAACAHPKPYRPDFISFERPCGRDTTVAADTVIDQPVTGWIIPSPFQLRYPDRLRSRDIEGDVQASYVVDTTGHVIPASMRIVIETFPEFGDAVCNALPNLRFNEFVVNGRVMSVRVLSHNFKFNVLGKSRNALTAGHRDKNTTRDSPRITP